MGEGYTLPRFLWVSMHNVWSNEYLQYCIHPTGTPTKPLPYIVTAVLWISTHSEAHSKAVHGMRATLCEWYTMCCGLWYVYPSIQREHEQPITLSDRDGMLSSSDIASFPGFPMQEWQMQAMENWAWEQSCLRHSYAQAKSPQSTLMLEVALFPGLPCFSPLFRFHVLYWMQTKEQKKKRKKRGSPGNKTKLALHVTMKVEGMCLMLMQST